MSNPTRKVENEVSVMLLLEHAGFKILNVIQVTLNAKMTMPDSQQYPLNLFLIKTKLDIIVFGFFQLFNLICGFSAKVTCAFLVYEKQ